MSGPLSLTELSELSPGELDDIRAAAGAISLPRERSVVVLRHDDVIDALANPQLGVRHRFRTTIRLYGGSTVIDTDGPDHRRQRKPVVRGLMASLEAFTASGGIDEIAARAVADLRKVPVPELVDSVAVRVVTEVMAVMTGLSPEEALRLHMLHRPIVGFLAGDGSEFTAARANLADALDLYAHRKPAVEMPDAHLARALERAVLDGTLSEPEFRRNRILLFMGGTETTVCAVSNVLWMVATNKGLLGRLRGLNASELKSAVAEMLRLQPPMFSLARFAVRALDIRGIPVKDGTAVHLCLASACRDPLRFENPGRLWLTRPTPTNLIFGHGVHFCPGAAIANLEIMAILRALIREARDIRLVDDPPPPVSGTMFRLPRTLKASVDWAASPERADLTRR